MAGDEMTIYDLRVTVERIEGRSVCGLAVGDYFELTESSRVRIPPGRFFCLYALQSVIPLLPAKQRRLPDSDWLEQDSLVSLPGSGRARDHADRADRRADDAQRRPHVTTCSSGSASSRTSARRVRRARPTGGGGFDVVSVYHDLLFQPAIAPLLLIAQATERVRVGPAALNPYAAPSRSPARSPRSTRSRTGAPTSASSRAPGWTSSASRRSGR